MRQNTFVGHGEVLVIRKLVVAGIVTAEKAYLDCLYVAKEVYISLYMYMYSGISDFGTLKLFHCNRSFYKMRSLAQYVRKQ